MVSRVFYDEKGRITGHEVLDKFGRKSISLTESFLLRDSISALFGSWQRDRSPDPIPSLSSGTGCPDGDLLNLNGPGGNNEESSGCKAVEEVDPDLRPSPRLGYRGQRQRGPLSHSGRAIDSVAGSVGRAAPKWKRDGSS